MTLPLEGRVAVVTGASSGIGLATARRFAHDGARVALLARSADVLARVSVELEAAGGEALAVTTDVTDGDSLVRAAGLVREALGRADVLVNAAGEALLAPFREAAPGETRRLVEVNLLGSMLAAEAFLPQLCDGGGDLVNISSVGGRKARPGASVYNSTKWGICGWSEGLRQELLPDVRVILVEPGAVDTPIVAKGTHKGGKAAYREVFPPGTMLEADDVADMVAFAVSRPRHVAVNEILLRPSTQVY